ncbi:MAG: UvrD-helicase domain-containing protein [Defluviitaleaceae bacterium]|nr:UvrD-helicase domain-containing protein [Defluviitaleaceae bacterium]MCL2835336.1 UvrD-helicase domain-containing protein [Defluviitaleaceae bacterium]
MNEIILNDEQINADETLDYLQKELAREAGILAGKRGELKDINKILWTDYSDVRAADREKLSDVAQYLMQLNLGARSADVTSKLVAKYERLLDSPYFGRFDLTEKDMLSADKIYIGFHNLFDLKQGRVYIYDWRSPIASVYYRYELGKCHYDAPDGRVEGEVLLKRQLKFRGGELKYYADSGLVIRDEILLEALSQNATPKMKTIVETIQKEQDQIIRDLTSGALIVNGVAGSGKTSIALHRIAYLMYESKITGVTHKNILALTPSDAFADYIGEVLPSLGEERIKQITIDDIYIKNISNINIQTKNQHLESLTRLRQDAQHTRLRASAFKSSRTMAEILNRYALLYERRLHEFEDIALDGQLLYTKERLKALFLENKANLPAAARLKRIRDRVKADAEPVFDGLRIKLKEIVLEKTYDKWAFEVDNRVAVLLNQIKNRFYEKLRGQTSINPVRLYMKLTGDRYLLCRASKGLRLPDDAAALIGYGRSKMKQGLLPFADAGAVLYLTERLCGIKNYANYRHVVIDEAQDYGVVNYLTFKRMFPNARYTILGDTNQAVGLSVSRDFFRRISLHMGVPKTATLALRKSYRSSVEIQDFCNRILGRKDSEVFQRSGHAPEIMTGTRLELLDHVNKAIKAYGDGIVSAILTKTADEAAELAHHIETEHKSLITAQNEKLSKHLNIMPVYMSKGLEFDFVIVWDAGDARYNTPYDRNLLYVACTRALHRLHICAEGAVSRFLR